MDVQKDSSKTYKWGLFVLCHGAWSTCGFYRTEKAAKRVAIDMGVDPG